MAGSGPPLAPSMGAPFGSNFPRRAGGGIQSGAGAPVGGFYGHNTDQRDGRIQCHKVLAAVPPSGNPDKDFGPDLPIFVASPGAPVSKKNIQQRKKYKMGEPAVHVRDIFSLNAHLKSAEGRRLYGPVRDCCTLDGVDTHWKFFGFQKINVSESSHPMNGRVYPMTVAVSECTTVPNLWIRRTDHEDRSKNWNITTGARLYLVLAAYKYNSGLDPIAQPRGSHLLAPRRLAVPQMTRTFIRDDLADGTESNPARDVYWAWSVYSDTDRTGPPRSLYENGSYYGKCIPLATVLTIKDYGGNYDSGTLHNIVNNGLHGRVNFQDVKARLLKNFPTLEIRRGV